MPVEFLTDEQASVFGRFTGPPSQTELDRAFLLDDADFALSGRRVGDHNRLGFCLQLTTVRFLGTFLADPLDVPAVVLDYVAGQLEVADPSVVKRYLDRRTTRFENAEVIAADRGYRVFREGRGGTDAVDRRSGVDDRRRAEGPVRRRDAVAAGAQSAAAGG